MILFYNLGLILKSYMGSRKSEKAGIVTTLNHGFAQIKAESLQ